MKNRGIFVVVSSSIIIVVISVLYVLSLENFDKKLLKSKWYHYDSKTGYSEILSFNDNELFFYNPSTESKTDEYSYCTNYKYNKSTRIITLDCGKKISIKNINNEKIKVNIDKEEYYFFKMLEDSKKYEFKNYFGSSIEEYGNKNKQALEIIKISNAKLNSLIKEEEYSKIIFMGDNCNNIECTLLNELIEKWISYSKNVYYVNSNELDTSELELLHQINSEFLLDINEYNSIYPKVYIVNNKKIMDKYEVICSGFNCASYYNK